MSRWGTYPEQWRSLHCRLLGYRLRLSSWCLIYWTHLPEAANFWSAVIAMYRALWFRGLKDSFFFSPFLSADVLCVTVELASVYSSDFHLAVEYLIADIVLLFSMGTFHRGFLWQYILLPCLSLSAVLQPIKLFPHRRGKKLLVVMVAFTPSTCSYYFLDGSIYLSTSPRVEPISCHYGRVQQEKAHVPSKSGKTETFLWDFVF